MKAFRWDGESVENCVFLHYRRLGLCLIQENWTGVIWELFREERSLIGSKGLLYTAGPADEPCFLTLLQQTQMAKHRLLFELSTIRRVHCDITQMSALIIYGFVSASVGPRAIWLDNVLKFGHTHFSSQTNWQKTDDGVGQKVCSSAEVCTINPLALVLNRKS